MTYDSPPRTLTSLNQRLRNLAGDDALVLRRRTTMALVIVGQMLPGAAIKGGSALALRYGTDTRFTRDLDTARSGNLAEFRSAFEERLRVGWCGFTGRLIERTPPRPQGVPSAYVMRPFEVKLDFEGRAWCTVPFELSDNGLGDADAPAFVLAPSIAALFTELGFQSPAPVPVVAVEHQIAQKIHASTAQGSDRARDLVDLQLLAAREDVDLADARAVCTRLFAYRKAHAWPPTVISGESWPTLYSEAARGLDVASDLNAAIEWTNRFISQIDHA